MKLMKKFFVVSISIIVIVLIALTILEKTPLKELIHKGDIKTGSYSESLIGGQRDEHGCLGPAGYTYNEKIKACVREWELDESQLEAAKLAVEDLDYEYPTISKVEKKDNEDIYTVCLINENFEEKRVNVIGGKVSDYSEDESIITKEQCDLLEGRTIELILGYCNKEESNAGYLKDGENLFICCIKKQMLDSN